MKSELDRLVLETFEHAARELGLAPSASAAVGGAYLKAVERLGGVA